MFRKEIVGIKLEQKVLKETQDNIHVMILVMKKRFNKYLSEKLAEVFPEVKFYWLEGFDGGCHTTEWEPKAWIYGICENGSVLKYDEEKNVWWNQKYDVDTPTKIVDVPVDVEKLRKFMLEVSKETGVTLTLVVEKFPEDGLYDDQ